MVFEKCDRCGLPPDLCACEELASMNKKIKIARQGIVSPHRIYYCSKCKKDVEWSETETFFCPCCERSGLKHKLCGGIVEERDPFRLPILY
jgi:predicted amidophosphoribosyltransferase